jgi:hypothetical protein
MAELLYGYRAIADHLGLTVREVRHQVGANGLPVFKLGQIVAARLRTLHRWLDEQEAKPLPPKPAPVQPRAVPLRHPHWRRARR